MNLRLATALIGAFAATAIGAQQQTDGPQELRSAAATIGAARLPSGVFYRSLQEGLGASPLSTDTVLIQHRGYFLDGREFDSSYQRGKPLQLGLQQIIPCWAELLTKMRVGGRAVFICPSSLAYGSKGVGNRIPPDTPLQFDVELLAIVDPAQAARDREESQREAANARSADNAAVFGALATVAILVGTVKWVVDASSGAAGPTTTSQPNPGSRQYSCSYLCRGSLFATGARHTVIAFGPNETTTRGSIAAYANKVCMKENSGRSGAWWADLSLCNEK